MNKKILIVLGAASALELVQSAAHHCPSAAE